MFLIIIDKNNCLIDLNKSRVVCLVFQISLKIQMVTREIQQHLENQESESSCLNQSSVVGVNNLTTQNLSLANSRQGSAVGTRENNYNSAVAQQIDEIAEIERNLDPSIYQDRDFVSEHLLFNNQNNNEDLSNSKTSFIELTTQIGNKDKIKRPSLPSQAYTHHTTINRKALNSGDQTTDTRLTTYNNDNDAPSSHDENSASPVPVVRINSQSVANQRIATSMRSNGYANRKMMKANVNINSKTQRVASTANPSGLRASNDDYQIMHRDESTDIRLPGRSIASHMTKSSRQGIGIQIRGTANLRASHHIAASRQSRLAQRGDNGAAIAIRKSKDKQMRSVLAKAYKAIGQQPMQPKRKYQPTLGQQSMLSQQQINSKKQQQSQQPFNNFDSNDFGVQASSSFDESNLYKTRFSSTTYDKIKQELSMKPVFTNHTQYMNIRGSQTTALDALSNGHGHSRQVHRIMSQSRYQATTQETRVKNLQEKIAGKRRPAQNRPRTGYQVRSSHLNMANEANTTYNKDLLSQMSSAKHLEQQSSFLKKNDSEMGFAKPNLNKNNPNSAFLSLTSHQSGITSGPGQNRVRYMYNDQQQKNNKDDILSEGQAAMGLGIINRQNLNQVSSSSFVFSETRNETNVRGNNSPEDSSQNRLAQFTVQSAKEDETILSLNVKPTVGRGLFGQPHGQPQPIMNKTERNSAIKVVHNAVSQPRTKAITGRSKKQKQLILFTNGDQVKLDIPAGVASAPQQNSAAIKRKSAAAMRAAHYETQPSGRKWVGQNGCSRGKPFKLPQTSQAEISQIIHNGQVTLKERELQQQQQLQQSNKTNKNGRISSQNHHESIQTGSVKNRDLETPEIPAFEVHHTQQDKNEINLIDQKMQFETGATLTANYVSEAMTQKPSTPQPQQYSVQQVKSLLDHQTNEHNSTLSRREEVSLLGADEMMNYGSVQKIPIASEQQLLKQQPSGDINSLAANSYVRNLIERVDQKGDVDQEQVSREIAEYYDVKSGTQHLSQQVQEMIDTHGEDKTQNEEMSITIQSASILKPGRSNSPGQIVKSNELHSRKQVVIQDERAVLSQSHSSSRKKRRQPNILIKSSLEPNSLTRPQKSHQQRFHENCCGSSPGQSSQHSKSVNSVRSGSMMGVTYPKPAAKFVNQSKTDRSMPKKPMSLADLNALAKIKKETMAIDKRMNKSKSQARAGPILMKNDVVRAQTRSPESARVSSIKSKKRRDGRLNSSMVEKRAFRCEDCCRRTIDKGSCGTSHIEKGGFKVTNGSSQKGKNLTSRLGADLGFKLEGSTLSQQSMFNSTLKKAMSVMSTSRMSQNSNYKKILNRKFKISRDLSKYTKDLDYKQSERKLKMFSKTAKGKNLNEMRKRAEFIHAKEQKWAKEREILKNMDWEDSDLFEAFKESKETRKPIETVLQRFAQLKTVTADKMYTDVELQYFIQLIKKKDCKVDSDEVKEENRGEIVLQYFNRSLYTLQALTTLLKVDFHYDHLFKKYETEYTVDTVIMLMTRARKMYQAIEMILTIIKLLDKLKAIEAPEDLQSPGKSPQQRRFHKDPGLIQNLKERIRCHIKSFLAQHTLFPVQFKFGGQDQLAILKTNQKGHGTSHLSSESRIINLKVGGNPRSSCRSSSRNSSVKPRTRSESVTTNTKKGGKKNKKGTQKKKVDSKLGGKKPTSKMLTLSKQSSRQTIDSRLCSPVRSDRICCKKAQ